MHHLRFTVFDFSLPIALEVYSELLDSCRECDGVAIVDIVTNELLETGGSESSEKGDGVKDKDINAACCTLLEAGGSGGVEETTVGTVIVVLLNRTSAM